MATTMQTIPILTVIVTRVMAITITMSMVIVTAAGGTTAIIFLTKHCNDGDLVRTKQG